MRCRSSWRSLFHSSRVGTVSFNRLSHAMDRLGDAGLDLAKSKDVRVAACQKQVALCRDVEKICRPDTQGACQKPMSSMQRRSD